MLSPSDTTVRDRINESPRLFPNCILLMILLIKLFLLTWIVTIKLAWNHFSASVNNRNASIVLFYECAKFCKNLDFQSWQSFSWNEMVILLPFIVTVIWSTAIKLCFCSQSYLPLLNYLIKCCIILFHIQKDISINYKKFKRVHHCYFS